MPKIEKFSWQAFILAISTGLSYCLGGIDQLAVVLGICMIADFITGILASVINGNTESKKCFRGIVKKCCYLVLVVVGHCIDVAYPQDTIVFRDIVVYFLIANDGISILENIGECGVEYPAFIKTFLEAIKKKASDGEMVVEKKEEVEEQPIEEPVEEPKPVYDYDNYKALFPCQEGGLTKDYSSDHLGIDVGWLNVENCYVYAVEDGVVKLAENSSTGGDRGEYCCIEHTYGDRKYWSGYLHLLTGSLTVKNGDKVVKGQVIGKRGNTGLSNGTHLHLYLSDWTNKDFSYVNMKNACTIDPKTRLYVDTSCQNVSNISFGMLERR